MGQERQSADTNTAKKKPAKKLPRGVTIRELDTKNTLQVAFTYKGVRCREQIDIEPTTKNINYAKNLLGEIKNAIERQTFQYADYFPESPKLKIFGRNVDRRRTVLHYMKEYEAAAEKRGLSPSTLEGYRKLQLALSELHSIPVTELSAPRLKQFVLESGNTAKTLRNKFSYLRSALAEAVTDGLVPINPVDTIKLSNYVEKNNKVDLDDNHDDIDPFTPAEVEKIYEHCRPDELNIVQLVFNTGMRPSEWSALRWSDIDFVHKQIFVRVAIVHNQMKGPKSKAGKRLIPLNDIGLSALNRQKALSFLADGFVFPQNLKMPVQLPDGELNRVNPDSFRKHKWSRVMKSAGIRSRYPYQMRHTYATRHISEGVHLWQLANWMGHASPEMLFRHYGKFIEDYQKKQIELAQESGPNDTGKTRELPKPNITIIKSAT